ncbi:MAG TPA: hypothetical protein VF119_06320, partial [Candidatus Limnocylindrales bacterium]
DLVANLAFADGWFDDRLRGPIDAFIEKAGIDAPVAERRTPIDFDPPPVTELDLARAGISTVLWTSGYRQDLRWIDLPITDDMGFARQVRGVSDVPGLSFVGSLWQHDLASATLFGVGRDAAFLADRMGLGG